MIFLQLKIDNLYMFKESFIDFTYPKKNPNSTISGEFLTEFPNIKYKKVCVLMGANASGKTTLGRLMCSINNYLLGRPIENASKVISDNNKNATVEVTYVTLESKEIHKLFVEFNDSGLVKESYQKCKLKKSYSLNKALSTLNNSELIFEYSKNNNHAIENPGFKSVAHTLGFVLSDNKAWNYTYSDFNTSTELDKKHVNERVLENILKSFDNSIQGVKKINESEKNAYIIKFSNNDEVIIENGKILDSERLSRGTIESIDVADFIHFIMTRGSGVFFLDEKMAYSHSELEVAILNLLIEKLSPNSQLFYTTHNYDVLEMNLPSHSYIFMKKGSAIEIIHPEKLGYTKNDRTLLGFVKNDVFNTLPDTSLIDEISYE